MANLETLELTISANAASASKGIYQLIGSLSSLSSKVGKSIGALKMLNSELSSLKKFNGIDFSKATKGIKKVSTGMKEVGESVEVPGTKLDALKMKLNSVTDSMNQAARKGNQLTAATKKLQQLSIGKQIATEERLLGLRENTFKAKPSVLKEYSKLNPLKFKSWMYGPNPLPEIRTGIGGANMVSDDELRRTHPEWFIDPNSAEGKAITAARVSALAKRGDQLPIASRSSTLKQFAEPVKWTGKIKELIDGLNAGSGNNNLGAFINQTMGIGAEAKSAEESASVFQEKLKETPTFAERAKSALGKFKDGIKNLGSEIKNMLPKFNLLSRAMRIMQTMLIRMGVKALINGAKEGLQNFYQYAKTNNMAITSQLDSLSSSWATVKNQMGASLAPAFAAAIPVINALAGAAITAFNALSQLLALLSGKGTWTKATAQVEAFDAAAKKAGGGGGGMKELLADFDELNLIASEGGGGGGGGAGGLDYADMFEEVSTFSQEIKDIVKWIEDHMASILGMATAIGAAILGWKVSKAFEGLLSQLGGLLAAGAIIALTCQVVWHLDNQYFKDKNIGWLIADLLVSALGAVLAGKIIGSVLGGKTGYVAAGITLALSALTTIVALLKNSDVSALSKEGILTALVAALKAGAGIGLIAYGTGASVADAVISGVAGAFIVFGVTIGLKTILDDKVKLFSMDHIMGAIVSALSVFTGVYMIAKNLMHLNTTSALGISGASALITIGAVIGLKAILDDDVQGLSRDHIIAALTSGLSVGGGLFILGKSVLSDFVSSAWALGVGSAFITIGAVIGIKAVAQYDGKDLTPDTVKQGLLGALGIGVGAGFVAKAFGAGLASIGLVGLVAAGATLFTLGAVCAVKALLATESIEWGNISLTEQQVKDFVKEKMFDVDIEATVQNISLVLGDVETAKSNLQTQINTLLGDMNMLTLGIDSAATYEKIKTQIGDSTTEGTILNSISSLADANIDLLKITFANVKALDSNGNDMTADTLLSGVEGWNAVKSEMNALGTELTELLFKGAKDQLTPSEKEYVKELLEKINDISRAITTSKVAGDALTTLELSLKDLTKESVGKVTEEFTTYKSSLESALRESMTQVVASYNQLAAYYISIGKPEIAEQYSQMAKDLAAGMDKAINESLKSAIEPGRKAVQEWLDGIFKNNDKLKKNFEYLAEMFEGGSWMEVLTKSDLTADNLKLAIQDILYQAGVDKEVLDLMDVLEITGWEYLSEDIQKKIIASITITPETLTVLKETLKISATELITLTDWEAFSLDAKLNFFTSLVKAFGAEEVVAAAKAAGINIDNLIAEGMSSNDTVVQNKAKKLARLIKDEIEKVKPKVNATADVTVNVDAIIAVKTTSSGNVTATSRSTAVRSTARPTQLGGETYSMFAGGAYDIPRGDVFIANEAGAELVGSINGKTSVANQGQIIEGIQKGVRDANADQNTLLRQQNDLLRQILEKDTSVRIGASAALGKVASQSLNMYNRAAGVGGV